MSTEHTESKELAEDAAGGVPPIQTASELRSLLQRLETLSDNAETSFAYHRAARFAAALEANDQHESGPNPHNIILMTMIVTVPVSVAAANAGLTMPMVTAAVAVLLVAWAAATILEANR